MEGKAKRGVLEVGRKASLDAVSSNDDDPSMIEKLIQHM
jgi:hypothetical protein